MKRNKRFPKLLQSVVLAGGIFAGILGTAITAKSQELKDIQTPKTRFVLKAQDSFFVAGETQVVFNRPALQY